MEMGRGWFLIKMRRKIITLKSVRAIVTVSKKSETIKAGILKPVKFYAHSFAVTSWEWGERGKERAWGIGPQWATAKNLFGFAKRNMYARKVRIGFKVIIKIWKVQRKVEEENLGTKSTFFHHRYFAAAFLVKIKENNHFSFLSR